MKSQKGNSNTETVISEQKVGRSDAQVKNQSGAKRERRERRNRRETDGGRRRLRKIHIEEVRRYVENHFLQGLQAQLKGG